MERGVRWLLIAAVAACARVEPPEEVSITLLPPGVHTRSSDPQETLVTDYNIFVFNSFGLLEYSTYVPRREYGGEIPSCSVRLVKEAPYTVLAAANLGYELVFQNLEEALQYRYHMAYPDEFQAGMPMAACMADAVAGKDLKIIVPLERLMSRVDLRIDRRELNEDVSIRITFVTVCDAASSVLLFGDSVVDNWSNLFGSGYYKSGPQVYPLNHDTLDGMSGEVSLYLLENRPGGLVQSYVEVKAEYHSATQHTRPGEYLIFRFYLTENHDTRRNTCYPIILKPSATGLDCPDGWRLDKSALEY